jgi:hypothetical protein
MTANDGKECLQRTRLLFLDRGENTKTREYRLLLKRIRK